MAESKISDPNLKVFKQTNLQLAELWAKAMNPTGVMRTEDRQLALDVLSMADGPEAYKAAVNSLIQSIGREKAAAKTFMEERGLAPALKKNPKALSVDLEGGPVPGHPDETVLGVGVENAPKDGWGIPKQVNP